MAYRVGNPVKDDILAELKWKIINFLAKMASRKRNMSNTAKNLCTVKAMFEMDDQWKIVFSD